MAKQHRTFSLTCEDREAPEAICRCRKVDALVWKRARAFLLPDAGYDAKLVCGILDIGPAVLTEWRFAFSGAGLSFFDLKDYSQRQGHSSVTQEQGLKARFTEHPARNVDEICACILTEYGQIYSIRLDQGEFCDHSRSALTSAFAISISFLMSAVRATLAGLPAAIMAWYFLARSGLWRAATRAGM